MGIKRGLQLSLVILLLLSSVFFYQKFFKLETNLAERKINEEDSDIKNEEDSDIKKEIDKSNLIQSLKYVSKDLVGNTYIINAESAKFEKDETDNIFLFIVNAEIIRKDNEVIKIYSDTANYNRKNNNTVFKKNVSVKYADQIVRSGILKLNFSKNLIEIFENVYYMNKNTKMYADKVELDYLRKKMRVSMINQNDNVEISSRY